MLASPERINVDIPPKNVVLDRMRAALASEERFHFEAALTQLLRFA